VKVLMIKEMKIAIIVMLFLVITTLVGFILDKIFYITGPIYIIPVMFTSSTWIFITIVSIVYTIWVYFAKQRQKISR